MGKISKDYKNTKIQCEYFMGPKTPIECKNQEAWELARWRCLHKHLNRPYMFYNLDKCTGNERCQDMLLQIRDTVDNMEAFIEHEWIYIKEITQDPLMSIEGYTPDVYKSWMNYGLVDGADANVNWVNKNFVKQNYNVEYTSLTERNYDMAPYIQQDVESNVVLPDIINPDERLYNVTICIDDYFFIKSAEMKFDPFDIILRHHKDTHSERTFLSCNDIIRALEYIYSADWPGSVNSYKVRGFNHPDSPRICAIEDEYLRKYNRLFL